MYAVVLYVYWSNLLWWQKAVASLVAIRELFYILLLMVCTWCNPAFLLVDIAQSMGSLHDSLHPINGWFVLVVYTFAPEKFVMMSLLQCQDQGHDNHSCLSFNSPYVRPRNKLYRDANANGDGQRRDNYLPSWVTAWHFTVLIWLFALLDICGSAALVLNYVPALRTCAQFHIEGGLNVPVELIKSKDLCIHRPEVDVAMDASQCMQNSQTMLRESNDRLLCRYTAWPDALLFSYWVTVLSGFVMVLFSVYRWCFPVVEQKMIKDSQTGELKWVLPTSTPGEYLEVGSKKLVTTTSAAPHRQRKVRKAEGGRGRGRGSRRSQLSGAE
jgi:hypothetical protein